MKKNKIKAAGILFSYLLLFSWALAHAQIRKPDEGVSGVSLQSGKSTTLVLGENVWEKRFEKADDFGFIRLECLNANAKQLLRVGFFEGGIKNQAQVFQLSYVPLNYALSKKTVRTHIPNFISNLKIRLNMPVKELLKIIGPGYKVSLVKEMAVYDWHTTDLKSPILKKYRAVGYFTKASFNKSNRLVEYTFGFDYP